MSIIYRYNKHRKMIIMCWCVKGAIKPYRFFGKIIKQDDTFKLLRMTIHTAKLFPKIKFTCKLKSKVGK